MECSLQEFEKSCVRRAIVSPHWLSGSDSVFWYRREGRIGEFQFILVDCERELCRTAFDHAGLASELGKYSKEQINPGNLPFSWINVPVNAAWVRFQFDGQTWQYTDDGKLEVWQGGFDPGSFDYGCEEVPSPYSRQASDITFINNTADAISCYWISNSGDPQHYGSIQPDQSKTISSYVGHLWRLSVDDSEKRVACTVKNGPCTVTIGESPLGLALRWETALAGQESPQAPSTGPKPFIRNFNLWCRSSDGAEKQISFDGNADNEFKDMYPSPNGRHVVVKQCRPPSKQSLLYMVDSSPKDQLRPALISEEYLRPGDNVEHQRPRLFDLEANREMLVDDALFRNPFSLTNVGWSGDGRRYRFLFNQRGHQSLRLLEITMNGTVTVLVEESSKTFVDYANKLFYKLLPSSNEILWASERDGWNHLYLFTLDDGTLKNQVTKGPWVVRSVEHIDEEKRRIWFRAFGIEPGQDPYYAHLASVAFDGSDLRVLSKGDGTHTWTWGPKKRFLLDSWSRVDSLPQAVVREARTGKRVVSLQQVVPHADWMPPERFAAPGRDGKTSIYGIIIRPSDFHGATKYPVIEYIYAGPQGFNTPKAFQDLTRLRRVANQGYVLVCMDGMGTNWRSKAFHDVCYKDLKDGGFADRIAWIRSAAESRPWMDLSRVGCYGVSAGGQNAAAAVIHHGGFYKAAFASAGCHDNRMDKLWWNEMWMGYPVDASYEDSSNMTHAHKLSGALMLAVGELDKNVDPASTLRLASALIEADKDFDLVFVPGGSHHVHTMTFVMRKQDAFFRKHLKK
ncbi:hypothetical protein RJ55_05360 [Drechmeria coniospora]|nr:hypothetical protein RJ55_05360 [Drechmeria coniospora]